MRVFLTGGTGFIGSEVAKRLRTRGDEVVAFVRSRARATVLEGIGCEIAEGDLARQMDVVQAIGGCEAVLHLAGRFDVGIRKADCGPMADANVGGLARVIEAAETANISRIVHVSTVNVFGNTNGEVVDESYRRDASGGFPSCYDLTKYQAHQYALRRIAEGLPIVIAQPGLVYGPGDHSEIGREITLLGQGKLSLMMLVDIGLSMVHVDDVADGLLRVLDGGTIGEAYVLAGENVHLRDAFALVAGMTGQKMPLEIPTLLLKLIAPVGPFVAPRLGYPPNMFELIGVADRKTYWASSRKAQNDLEYTFRSLEEGLKQTLSAAGVPTG